MKDRKKPVDPDEYYSQDDSNDGIELGPRPTSQISISEKLRLNLSHGYMMKDYDEIERKRSLSEDAAESEPEYTSPQIFDNEVEKFKKMSSDMLLEFDNELMYIRGETRLGSGVIVNRSSFGSSVFGFAYHTQTGRWNMTNKFGLHATCAKFLLLSIDRTDLDNTFSGFVFKVPGFESPIMNLFGFINTCPEDFRKALEDIWSWKRFIIVSEGEKSHRYDTLFTPKYGYEYLKRIQNT